LRTDLDKDAQQQQCFGASGRSLAGKEMTREICDAAIRDSTIMRNSASGYSYHSWARTNPSNLAIKDQEPSSDKQNRRLP
jgi:hypothetical protein